MAHPFRPAAVLVESPHRAVLRIVLAAGEVLTVPVTVDPEGVAALWRDGRLVAVVAPRLPGRGRRA